MIVKEKKKDVCTSDTINRYWFKELKTGKLFFIDREFRPNADPELYEFKGNDTFLRGDL